MQDRAGSLDTGNQPKVIARALEFECPDVPTKLLRPWDSALIDGRRADASPPVDGGTVGSQRMSERRTSIVLERAKSCGCRIREEIVFGVRKSSNRAAG